ncbi:MAG: hypothetical protein ACYTDT_05310 [Planctomycetota bacterium]|jgi:hypothetical protein
MRLVFAAIAFLSAVSLIVAQSSELKQTFDSKLQKVNSAVALSHYKLAKDCFRLGLNIYGYAEAELAFECVPDHEKTQKLLGYKLKDGKWVLLAKKAPPKADSDKASDASRKSVQKSRDRQRVDAAKEYVKLAKWANKQSLATRAKVLFTRAAGYDPLNETALTGAGWQKDEHGNWQRPAVVAELAELKELTDGLPTSSPLEQLPEDFDGLAQGIDGQTIGGIQIIRTSDAQKDAGQKVWLLSEIATKNFGTSNHRRRLVLVFNKAEHKKYVALRFPDSPGLAEDDYIVGNSEVEVLCSPEDKAIELERAVYAFAIREIHERAGEGKCHWLAVGFASNMTRRLLSSIQTAEHEGVAEGPAEVGRWKRTLKQKLANAKSIDLDSILAADILTETELIYAHYFTRWLMQEKSDGLASLVAALSGDAVGEEALEQAFGEAWEELEKRFIRWVRKEL